MSALPGCAAVVAPDHIGQEHVCRKPAREQRMSRPVCGVHARKFDRWKSSPSRDEREMAKFWWGWL